MAPLSMPRWFRFQGLGSTGEDREDREGRAAREEREERERERLTFGLQML